MADRPLERPAHLQPPDDGGPPLARRRIAALALVLGALSFLITAVVHGELSSTPPLWLTLPGFALTAFVASASLALREPRGYWLWAIGLGLAGAAIVLGWLLMLAIVIGATVIAILILHAVM